MSVVNVVCCQIEVSATSWSLVHRIPKDCGASLCVIEKPREWGGPWPTGAKGKKKARCGRKCSWLNLRSTSVRDLQGMTKPCKISKWPVFWTRFEYRTSDYETEVLSGRPRIPVTNIFSTTVIFWCDILYFDLFHLPTLMHNSFFSLTICMLHYNLLSSGILHSCLQRVTIPDAVIIRFVLLKMGMLMLDTCRGS